MKRFTKLMVLPMLTLALTSCDILGTIRGITGLQPKYDNYEEFFAKGLNYTYSVSFDTAMTNINKNLRYWTRHNSQYSSSSYAIVETPNFETIYDYAGYFAIYTNTGVYIKINKEAESDGSILYASTDTANVCVDGENHKWRRGDSTKNEDRVSENDKAYINVYSDDSGYLVVTADHAVFYISKDLKHVYFNDTNTKTFRYMTGKDQYETATLSDSEALSAALLAAKNSRVALALPKPSNDDKLDKNKYWYGFKWRNVDLFGEVDAKQQEYITSYYLYFPGIEAYTYAQQLEADGWTIHRANDEDAVYISDQKYDSYWVAVDESESYKITLSDHTSLYADLNALFTDGPAHSTRVMIDRIGGMEHRVAGKPTTATDWTDREKRTMRKWYDLNVELPFVALSDSYSVPLTNSTAYNGLYSNLLELGAKSYNIEDHYYKYLLDGYGEVLEAAGFHKYEMPASVDINNYSTVYEWYKDPNHKLYNAYVDYDRDVAVRFYFDSSLGNVIRFFKISLMTAWDPTRDPDTTDYDALEDPYITVNPDE